MRHMEGMDQLRTPSDSLRLDNESCFKNTIMIYSKVKSIST
jgi:hypothetical protein